MRLAVLAILASLFLASPNALHPFLGLAASFILLCEFRDLWRDMSRSRRRQEILGSQIRGYADALQNSRRPLTARRYI